MADMVSPLQADVLESPGRATVRHHCRLCGSGLSHSFADLGMSPLANSFIAPADADRMEPFYPLHAFVCDRCWLVQLAEFEQPDAIFSSYLYFSSVSKSWLRHAEIYAQRMRERFGLDGNSLVVEVASNDGYLLQYFKAGGVPVLGIDPAANVGARAIDRGIPTECAFFGAETARRLQAGGIAPDLMTANNVLAHVPSLHDFVEGFRILLAPFGTVTFEFPHLLRLMQQNQFDTIYHEHFSYLSMLAVERAFAEHGLRVYDVEELSTHGGSIRVFATHAANDRLAETPAVARLRAAEQDAGLASLEPYRGFAERTAKIKCDLLSFLIEAKRSGKRVAGYGAPAKGNTLLNYCGVGPELLAYTADLSEPKQGLLLPGTRIPIRVPDAIMADRPDYVLILPWNLQAEIAAQLSGIRAWGGQFVVPIPELRVF